MIFTFVDYDNTEFRFDFGAYDGCVEINSYYEDGLAACETSIIRIIKDKKVVWSHFDYGGISYEAMKYCDKLVKNLAFA